MSSSQRRITITLGGTGQVVKRGPASDVNHTGGSRPILGLKRSLRERLGSSNDDHYSHNRTYETKRRRPGGGVSDEEMDYGIGKGDLRLKLIKKGLSKKTNGTSKHDGVDLREKLNKNARSSARYFTRTRGEQQPGASNVAKRIPTRRSADDLLQLDSSGRRPYSSYLLDRLRHTSPDRFPSYSRGGLPSPRKYDGMRPISALLTVDPSRPSGSLSREVLCALQPSTYMSKLSGSVAVANGINRGAASGSAVPTNPLMVEESITVSKLLNSLGLEKYNIMFQAEEVDIPALRQMKDSDLKELGIPMGPRKKILLAVASYMKQHQSR